MSTTNFNYTIQLNLQNKPCLIVGGGKVGTRKALLLVKAKAKVTILDTKISEELIPLVKAKKITHIKKDFYPGVTEKYFLVIAATNNISINKNIATEAKRNGLLINVADNCLLGNFAVAGKVEMGPITISVSTGNPRLTQLILEDLKTIYGKTLPHTIAYINNTRQIIKDSFPAASLRERFWKTNFTLKDLQNIRNGKFPLVKEKIENAIASYWNKS